MKARVFSAKPPAEDLMLICIAESQRFRRLSQDVPALDGDGARVRVPPLVVEAMIHLRHRACPEQPSVLAGLMGERTETLANALTRFTEGAGAAFVEKNPDGRYKLTRRGSAQAARYMNEQIRLRREEDELLYAPSSVLRRVEGQRR